jgi:ureidoglycolate lyase
MPTDLIIEPLTEEAFADFGDVIDTQNANHFLINEGRVCRYHDLARVELGGDNSRALINIFECNIASEFPLTVSVIERHPLGSQAFYPLTPVKFVVVVGKAGMVPGSSELRAFETNGEQGVNYHSGVWHMPLVVDQAGLKFLVVDRGGDGNNCEEFHFDNEVIHVVR